MSAMRRWLGIILLTVTGTALPACAPATSGGGDGDLLEIDFALNWAVPYSPWTGFYAAQELGLYADEGLDVNFMLLAGSSPAVQTVGATKADLGSASADAMLVGKTRGLPVRAVALYQETAPYGILTRADSGIERVEDLKGKTVSTAVASPEGAILRAALTRHGIDPDRDVEFLNVQPEAKVTTMLSGKSDAGTGLADWQAVSTRLAGHEVRFIPFATEKQPLYGPVVFVNERFMEEHPDAIRGFLRASREGFAYAENHVKEVVKIYRSENPEADEGFLTEAIKASHSLMTGEQTRTNGWGWMDNAGWALLQNTFAEGEMIPRKFPVDELYTTEFLPESAGSN